MKNQLQKEEIHHVQQAAMTMAEVKTGLVLTGRIQDGKVVFDQASLDQVASKYPKGDVAFVALNAPFDPKAEPALA